MARDEAQIAEFAFARERVLDRIAAAAARVGHDPAEVTLVAVSKTVPAERLASAVAAGLTTLGENRVQEAEGKAEAVGDATWHLVGPLQSNKVRRALEVFDTIQSVDSVNLARRIDRLAVEVRHGERVPVLLQVNVDDDAAKAGFSPAAIDEQLGEVLSLEHIDVRGLMTVGQLVERPADARPTFVALRSLGDRLRARHPGLGPGLSMGMTDDYDIAVEEGATIVRVGRALFGERH